jgi:Cu+-exporting ATPase
VDELDPVCGMTVDPASAAAPRHWDGQDITFCSNGCASAFDADPDSYLKRPSAQSSHHPHP